MKPRYALLVAVLVGIVIGATGIIALHAQGTPPGYVLAEIEVTDPGTFRTFAAQFPATLAPFNGRAIVLGGKTESLQGPPPKGIVILAFDSMATARRWYDSPAYQAIKPLLLQSSTGRSFIVEGTSP